MRRRDRILENLEAAYREAFERAEKAADADEMARLDFAFQRDQIEMEVLLDIRDLLTPAAEEATAPAEGKSLIDEGTALVEKAQKLRRMTRLL